MRLKSTLSKKRWKLMYVKSRRTSQNREMSSILSLKFNYYSKHSSRHILSYYLYYKKVKEVKPRKNAVFRPPLRQHYQILLFVYQLPLFDDDIIIPVLTSKYFWSQRAGKTTVKIKRVCKNWTFHFDSIYLSDVWIRKVKKVLLLPRNNKPV